MGDWCEHGLESPLYRVHTPGLVYVYRQLDWGAYATSMVLTAVVYKDKLANDIFRAFQGLEPVAIPGSDRVRDQLFLTSAYSCSAARGMAL